VFDDRHVYTYTHVHVLVILGASLFFSLFPSLPSFFRARTLHFVLPVVPGRELSDMEMHLIRYFRPKMSNVIEGAAGERHVSENRFPIITRGVNPAAL
jgi:hypothetical protein